PTAQFYHLATDQRLPYHVNGTQQDNSAIAVPSRGSAGAIPFSDCYPVGSSESGHIQVRPDNPNVVYSGAVGSAPGGGGSMLRYDHKTRQTRIITVWPEVYGGWGPKDLKYRFQWTYPILISPHDKDVLYTCGNQVFKSTDEGTSWETVSPDLTRNDPEKLGPSGGPITRDTTGAEHYCTIFAFAESLHERGVLWAGSDDGLIHLSKDGGSSWQNVTPPQLPEWTTITTIEPSPHDAATVYVTATRYKLDDFRPLLYKTNDYGKTWQEITHGIPADDISRAIREDPERRGLLYAGCESGVYVSFDDGGSWQTLQSNLPAVPVHDLQVKDGDLIAATHGRAFWVLDDLSLLRQAEHEIAQKPAHLFAPRQTIRARPLPGAGRPSGPGKNYSLGLGAGITYREKKDEHGRLVRTFIDSGQNPPEGVVVSYWLKEKPAGDVTLTFLDANGNEIKKFTSRPEQPEPRSELPAGEEGVEGVQAAASTDENEEVRVPKAAGANRFVWNLRYPDAHKVPGDATAEPGLPGPASPPRTCSVRLTVDGHTSTQRFEIVKDPRVSATQEDFDAQFEFLLRIREKLSDANDAVNQLRGVRDQVDAWLGRSGEIEVIRPMQDAGSDLKRKLNEIEEELIQAQTKGQLDSIHFPARLIGKLAALPSVVGSADAVPPKQTYDVYGELSGRIDTELSRLQKVLESDVPAFNRLVREAELPAVDTALKGQTKR
ncbi:MAG: WD40/YVTN/BNR-like repeat-containing protein, partial [Dehalococcoidia bacterium]